MSMKSPVYILAYSPPLRWIIVEVNSEQLEFQFQIVKVSKIVKNALYLKKSARTVTHEC